MLQKLDLISYILVEIANLIEINQGFLHDCDNLTYVNMGTISSKDFLSTDFCFTTMNQSAPIYNPGLTLVSLGDAAGYQENFPDQTASAPYRKLNIQEALNYIIYDNKSYELADNINPNVFCG